MKRSRVITLLFLSPYYLGFAPVNSDTSWTEFQFAVGAGSYADVARDCEGRVISARSVPFTEAGVSVDHYYSVLHLGLAAGIVPYEPTRGIFDIPLSRVLHMPWLERNENPRSVGYLRPIVGLQTTYFGLDGGYVAPLHNQKFSLSGGLPAGSVRIGRSDAFHLMVRLADDLPLISGGPGVGNIGFGTNLGGKPQQYFWLGIGGGPYDGLMFGTRMQYPLSDRILLTLGASIGPNELLEYGISAGTKVRF